MAGSTDPRARLLAKFRTVAAERVARMNAAFGALEQGSGEAGSADLLMREVHTLKGEAHMMGLFGMYDVAHRGEDLLTWAREAQFNLSGAASDLVYQTFDLLLAHVAADADEASLAARRAEWQARVRELLDGDVGVTAPRAAMPAPAEEKDGATPVGRGLGELIRVPGAAVQALTDFAGQLLIHQEATARLVQELWDGVRQSGDGERSGMVETVRRLREEVFEARLRAVELQDSVRHLRLLQVSMLFERYPAAIRELAREHGKRVRVRVEGGEVAVDKQVLDLIDEALLHLVRNSIDHGIESPAERTAAGKPERGTVVLSARKLGSRVEIVVRDDGRGIAAADVRAAAVSRGVLSEEEARAMPDDEVLRLLFRPGFTTRRDVSHLSGRGVGLDVVQDQVRLLGGTVELATSRGRGTTFTLVLPVSIALTRALCFRCGRVTFGLESSSVHSVLRVPAAAAEPAGAGRAIEVDGGRVPLVDLRRAFGARERDDRELEVVVIEHGTTRLALAVDALIGERQMVQRSLGAFLRGTRLISGTGVLEQRQVALLLSVPELVRQYGEGGALVHALPQETEPAPEWRILVVDDSEITRDMLVGLARRAGLGVIEAVNGREALLKLRGAAPDLILTDLDMPVMDGFELLATVRGDPGLRDTPVVVLTTRGSDEDRRRALAAGADAYLVKSEFSGEILNETISRYLEVRTR